MNKIQLTILLCVASLSSMAQTNPAITSWLQNTTLRARHYLAGNPTPINDTDLVNVQSVKYSGTSVYVTTTGLPSFITGPFMGGNPSLATNQNAIFKFPLIPSENTGTKTATRGGNIGIFINGVALFDFRDGVAWNTTNNTLCGGPGNPPCPGGMGATQDWNRDAILAERGGFDCAKAHPAMGNYHHHQNPSAFKLDKKVLSTICNIYNAEGLYAIDSTKHSPLIGFSADGFPIYGAYGYKNTDGTGGIVRIKSSYSLRNITVRDSSADGRNVGDGPAISTTYPLGYFREDYKFTKMTASDYLDEHNGRFCITPEYPKGIYCYFATVDANWNSAYPYVVGPTYFGNVNALKVTSITETVSTYKPNNSEIEKVKLSIDKFNIFPNPASELLVVQFNDLNVTDLKVELIDINGKSVAESTIYQGSTIAFFDIRTIYAGTYFVRISNTKDTILKSIVIEK